MSTAARVTRRSRARGCRGSTANRARGRMPPYADANNSSACDQVFSPFQNVRETQGPCGMPVTGGRSNARHPSVKTVGPVRHKLPFYGRSVGRGCAGNGRCLQQPSTRFQFAGRGTWAGEEMRNSPDSSLRCAAVRNDAPSTPLIPTGGQRVLAAAEGPDVAIPAVRHLDSGCSSVGLRWSSQGRGRAPMCAAWQPFHRGQRPNPAF